MPNIRCRLHSVQRTYAVFSNHRMTESMACTLQVLQNSRFPWHKAWALRQLAQTLAYMEKRSSPSVPWIHSCKESAVWLLTVFNLGHEGFIIKSATCVKENANWTVHSSSPIISLCEFLYSCFSVEWSEVKPRVRLETYAFSAVYGGVHVLTSCCYLKNHFNI